MLLAHSQSSCTGLYIPVPRGIAPSILASSSRFASTGVVSAPETHRGAGAPARPLITVEDVAKTYRTRDGDVESLKPLSFDIAEGEFMAIVGPSGCGKSTLLR